MVDIFISYSRTDKEKVGVLAHMIASEGYQVWWDADLPPHMSYGDVITAKIGAAKAVVVVWSDAATQSEWVRAEADVARNQKKLIQTSLGDIIPPLPFNQIRCAEIGDWNGEADHPGWSKVKESLVALCGPREETAQGEVASEAIEAAPATRSEPPHEPVPPQSKSAQSKSAPPAPPTNRKKGIGTPALIALGCGGLTLFSAIMLILLAMLGMSEEYWETSDDGVTGGGYIPQIDQAQPNASDAQMFLTATVQAPDDYTHVRASPSNGAPIVGTVVEGDLFTTYQQNTPWWAVLLEDGTEGYIYSERIFVIGPQ